jgi:hypothetical protein
MSRPFSVTIVVEGDPLQLAGYRARVNALLDADAAGAYRELHSDGRLDYRIKTSGVPYPPLVEASAEYPDLTVRVEWQNPIGGTGGAATIRAGKLVDQSTGGASASDQALELRAERDGTLVLAVALRRRRAGEWIGYALTAFLRIGGGAGVLEAADGAAPEWAERWTLRGDEAAYEVLDPREAVDPDLADELARFAHDFAEEWIWFAEAPLAETAIERQRYADYGYRVNAANVRAAKLRTVLSAAPGGGFALEAADPEARAAAALVARCWLQAGRH